MPERTTDPAGSRARTAAGRSRSTDSALGRIAVKVPAITALFWVIKVITTGMGEAASDYLGSVNIVLAGAVGIIGVIVAMTLQFRAQRYHAPTYWFAVAMIAVFGTMAADGLHQAGLSITETSIGYALALAAWLIIWYRAERTLNIHDINTRRREVFYWGTVLLTFALGTAVGDWTAFYLGLGFAGSIVLFAILMAIPGLLYRFVHLNSVVAFWATYILTRPLGASIADWLGKPVPHGVGLGDGTVALASACLAAALVIYLWRRGTDNPAHEHALTPSRATTADDASAGTAAFD